MASFISPTLVWLLLLAVPLRWLAAAYLDLLGPAHFHLDEEVHEQGLERHHGPSHSSTHGHRDLSHHHPHAHPNEGNHEPALEQRYGPSHSSPHGHRNLERHHHHRHDQTVVAADDDQTAIDSAALEEEGAQGGFGAMFLALVSARAALPVPWLPNCTPAGRTPILQPRFLEPPERPPRFNLA